MPGKGLGDVHTGRAAEMAPQLRTHRAFSGELSLISLVPMFGVSQPPITSALGGCLMLPASLGTCSLEPSYRHARH